MGRHMKNVVVVSFGFLLLFTATGSLLNLQSSLNADEGMGLASNSVTFSSIILSSMFITPTAIRYLGCKWTIFAGMACNVVYTVGNFYPSWATLMPSSVIVGLGESPLWAATSTYLTISGGLHAVQENKKSQDVINQYFGILYLLYQSSAVWGNLLSSLVFGQDPITVNSTGDDLLFCGVDSCGAPDVSSGNSTTRPNDRLVYTLLGCYVGVGVLAMLLVAVFLDNIDRKITPEAKSQQTETFCSTLLATFRQLKDKRQVLLIPVTSYIGLELGFLSADYTKNYVTCALGIHVVGYVMICFGVTGSLFSYVFGRLSQYSGRMTLFILAAVTQLSCILVLLLWKPHPDQLPIFFVIGGLWGMADAVWQTQTNALYGVLFHSQKEAAFANYRLWESVGYVIAFVCSFFLCVDVKLYMLLAVLLLSVSLCCIVEYEESKNPTPGIEDAKSVVPEEKNNVLEILETPCDCSFSPCQHT
ncbi:protein unc-93 homolog A-like [Alosa sapidissima]|uniref:protein unc-93 homolog A-like n=1 Tax=Alosa sapidissima TaxID=34773 RepID=UPI001C07F830|nr:protein unc-93 homolog A-like [Alosa sapidissima]